MERGVGNEEHDACHKKPAKRAAPRSVYVANEVGEGSEIMYNDVIHNGRFIWNRLKAEANHRKHGITFGKATEIFDDPFFVEEYDEENSENEDRYNIVGFVEGIYITVSFTLRDNLTRIFSARKADIEEEGAYNENIRRHIGIAKQPGDR